MKLASRWLVVGFLCFQFRFAQAQQSFDVPAATAVNDTVPCQLSHGFLVLVEGRIGPLANLKFILDSGTTRTIVDRKIADRLSAPRQSREVFNVDRLVKIGWAEFPEMQIGPLIVRNSHVMVGDLRKFSEFAEGVDAVVGMDVLRTSRSLQIDYDAKLVRFKGAAQSEFSTPKTADVPIVDLPVQGQRVRLVIDTGRQGILLYAGQLRKHQPPLRLTHKLGAAHEGRLSLERATLPGILLGSEELQTSVLVFPGDSFSADVDGLMGPDALNARLLELDFSTNTVRWR